MFEQVAGSHSCHIQTGLACFSWMSCIESQHSLTLSRKAFVAPADTDTVSELQEIPPGWSSECDEQLVHLLADNSDCNSSNLGTIKNYVDQITVSTTCVCV